MGIFRKSETLELSSNFNWILWFLFKNRLYLLNVLDIILKHY